MLRECIHGECAHEQHLRRTLTLTLTLTHTITAYSVSGNVVRVRILISATRQTPCRKRVYLNIRQFIQTRSTLLLFFCTSSSISACTDIQRRKCTPTFNALITIETTKCVQSNGVDRQSWNLNDPNWRTNFFKVKHENNYRTRIVTMS